MPRRNRIFLKALLPLGLLVVAVFALVRRGGDDWEYEQADARDRARRPTALHIARRRPAARFALAAAFTTLFFAGASFTAGAGDQMARLLDDDAAALEELGEIAAGREAAAGRGYSRSRPRRPRPFRPRPCRPTLPRPPRPQPSRLRSAVATPAAAAEASPRPLLRRTPPQQPTQRSSRRPAPAEQAPSNVVAPAPAEPSSETESRPAPAPAPSPSRPRRATPTKQWVVKRAGAAPALAPEIEHEHGEPTIWLNRALPDPTPASARLARSFARDLAAASKRHGADWAAVLGVLRAQGERGSVPATAAELDTLASRLAGENAWKGALAVSGRTAFADRAAGARRPLQVGRDRGARDRLRGREGAAHRAAARRRATCGSTTPAARISPPGGSTSG